MILYIDNGHSDLGGETYRSQYAMCVRITYGIGSMVIITRIEYVKLHTANDSVFRSNVYYEVS